MIEQQESLFVAVRVRPLLENESTQTMSVQMTEKNITVNHPRANFSAELDKVFTPVSTQQDVFNSMDSNLNISNFGRIHRRDTTRN